MADLMLTRPRTITVLKLREAIDWLQGSRATSPTACYIVYANPYEFTDGTGGGPGL